MTFGVFAVAGRPVSTYTRETMLTDLGRGRLIGCEGLGLYDAPVRAEHRILSSA